MNEFRNRGRVRRDRRRGGRGATGSGTGSTVSCGAAGSRTACSRGGAGGCGGSMIAIFSPSGITDVPVGRGGRLGRGFSRRGRCCGASWACRRGAGGDGVSTDAVSGKPVGGAVVSGAAGLAAVGAGASATFTAGRRAGTSPGNDRNSAAKTTRLIAATPVCQRGSRGPI